MSKRRGKTDSKKRCKTCSQKQKPTATDRLATSGVEKQKPKTMIYYAECINGKWIVNLDEICDDTTHMEILSKEYIYSLGSHQLCLGDEILIAKKIKKNLLILHYKCIMLQGDVESLELVYSRLISRKSEIRGLVGLYNEFCKDLWRRFDL